jgi:hypothetical protein
MTGTVSPQNPDEDKAAETRRSYVKAVANARVPTSPRPVHRGQNAHGSRGGSSGAATCRPFEIGRQRDDKLQEGWKDGLHKAIADPEYYLSVFFRIEAIGWSAAARGAGLPQQRSRSFRSLTT